MSEQGARLRRSLLAVGFLVMPWGGLGCESSSAAEPAPEAAAPGEPERVVQHMTPNPAPAADAAKGAATPAAGGPAARLGGNGASRSAEPITSQHLEAELNRLEAELAN
jgi:hypothetical protein